MTKKIIFAAITLIGVSAIACATAHIIRKNKEKKKVDNDSTADDIVEDEIIENDDDIHADDIIDEFIEFMVNNGINYDEVLSVVDTVKNIHEELPVQSTEVFYRMKNLINSEFNLEECHKFDKDNFKFFYSNLDIDNLFNRNGLKILALGPDHQEEMIELMNVLRELQDNQTDEGFEVLDEVYHILKNVIDSDSITPDTFDKCFKKFIQKNESNKQETPVTEDINKSDV